MSRALRIVAAGLVSWITLIGSTVALFGPAQAILADPDRQSAKFLAAMTDAPLPRVAEAPWLLPVGFLVLGLAHAVAFHLLRGGLPTPRWRRGITYGVASWLIGSLWFEYYLPWNVMREPTPLVVLELGCWLGVMVCNGLALAWMLPPDRPAEDPRALARRWMALWQGEDLGQIHALHTSDFVDHAPAGRAPDTAGFEGGIRALYADYPDFHAAVGDLIVDGDRVAVRWSATGTAPGADRPTAFSGVEVLHVRQGRIAARWGAWDGGSAAVPPAAASDPPRPPDDP